LVAQWGGTWDFGRRAANAGLSLVRMPGLGSVL
jgi:hypothetical protein